MLDSVNVIVFKLKIYIVQYRFFFSKQLNKISKNNNLFTDNNKGKI